MTTLTYDDLLATLLSVDDVKSYWSDHLKYWDGLSPGPTIDMNCFVEAVTDLIRTDRTEAAKKIVRIMNHGLEAGDDMTRNVVATGFLEGIMNGLSAREIEAGRIVPYLSEDSVRYCRAWDAANGTRTPGIAGGAGSPSARADGLSM